MPSRTGYKIGGATVVTAGASEEIMDNLATIEGNEAGRSFVLKYLSITPTAASNTIKINGGTPITITSAKGLIIEDIYISSIVVVSADTVTLIYKY